MLGTFRRFTKSRAGAVLAFVVLGVIALAFAAGDITGLGGGAGAANTRNVAEIGGEALPETELVTQTKNALRSFQQDQPTADMAGLIAQGGVETILEQLIDRRALARFGEAQGMRISDKAVDGVIASIPAFRGPDGRFSQAAFEGALQQQRLNARDVRADIARERIIQFLTAPANGGAKIGRQFALPYAALLLERRRGAIATIPATAVGLGAAPTEAELTAFYRANAARYTVPERRVLRYAAVTPASVLAQATPTDADLAAAFREQAVRFAASERRSAQVVTILDQGAANALAQRVRSGTALDAAARALGLEARTMTRLDKAAASTQSSAAVAEALFAAPANAVIGPLRSGAGYAVARLSGIERVPAKTLDQARAELLPEVTKGKQGARLTALNDAIDTAAGEGASFDEIVRDQKLAAQRTPALMQNGRDPLNLARPADPALTQVVQAAFAAEAGDAPQLVPVGTEGGFALVTLDSVVSAAPRPLAEIRADVARAFQLQRAQAAARKIAAAVVAKVDRGAPLAAALRETGLSLPATRPVDVPRAALAANPRGAEPALALLFQMVERRAKLLELPNRAGWAVVWLDTIVPGNAERDTATVTAAQNDLGRIAGRELVEQFARSIRNSLGVTRNPAAIARAKAELSGQAPDAQN